MNLTILMLEHDDDDQYITQALFEENNFPVQIHFVRESYELFSYLKACDNGESPYPSLILLDYHTGPLNVVQILRELKKNNPYVHIPSVVLAGSANKTVVQDCYEAGANSFIVKPIKATESYEKVKNFIHYWFNTVELPG